VFGILIRRLPWAIALTLVATLAGQATIAQPDDKVIPAAGINADTVDRLHAVKSTGTPSKRKGKLMALSAKGYLPNNVIRKAADADKLDGLDSTVFATITALQSAAGAINEGDNLVHWNQLFGTPPTIADGVDSVGYTSSTPAFVGGNTLANGESKGIYFEVPIGVDVMTSIIPADATYVEIWPAVVRKDAGTIEKHFWLVNYGPLDTTIKVRITVFDQGIAIAALRKIAKNIVVKVSKKPPRKW
jgi:hypothetical protein